MSSPPPRRKFGQTEIEKKATNTVAFFCVFYVSISGTRQMPKEPCYTDSTLQLHIASLYPAEATHSKVNGKAQQSRSDEIEPYNLDD